MNHKVNNSYRNLFTLSILFLCTSNVFADETPDLTKPKIVVLERIAGVDTVSAEQVIEALSSDKSPPLIDTRIKDDREFDFHSYRYRPDALRDGEVDK